MLELLKEDDKLRKGNHFNSGSERNSSLFEPFSVKVYPYDDLKRRPFQGRCRSNLFYVKQSLDVSQSREWIRCKLIQDSLNQFNIVGKVSAVLEVVVWKNNHKPLKQLNVSQWKAKSSHDREVILLIVIAITVKRLHEFCLSFKEKLRFAVPCRKRFLEATVLILCVLL